MGAQKHEKVLANIANGPGKMALAASLNEGMPVTFTIEREYAEGRRFAVEEGEYIVRGQLQLDDRHENWIIYIQLTSDKTIHIDCPKGWRCFYSTRTRKGYIYES